jgi:alpha-D-ribose 1-methylphosphonate 5-triphosphate synthase subunit PhnH
MPAVGFASPVLDAQRTFRSVLAAVAEPATIQYIDAATPDLGVAPAAIAVLLAMADIDTAVWVPAGMNLPLIDYLRFHTNAPLTCDPQRATFAFAPSTADLPPLHEFNTGTNESPETSTTVIIGVSDLTTGVTAWLDGPGFSSPRSLSPAGFGDEHWHEVAVNSECFPMGVDVLFACGSQIVALPRSTQVLRNHLSNEGH